ncbi:bifunctional adenosylcobinamide kinase/adenosylcobinamide-phosphate guanylyltransferase [Sporosarcina sp. FSL K6-1522]|uniref:bifunctional adenosylcobinamide kinase/adenosylcobinamide-phosphate guanylyltransferase n=1 Tax=Sporosarcina sp. FSL K6-1522 TaxID=2921554 RepID=UPI00315AD854
MRIYIGGAHNGKRDYVRTMLVDKECVWFEGECPPQNLPTTQPIVIAGLEKWLAETELPEAEAVESIMKAIEVRDVIVILTDIGRGIVPIDAQQRQLRDACGRLYQRLMAEADEVTRIWYGLAQILKKRGD